MQDIRPPGESENEKGKKEEPKRELPEFIVIEEGEEGEGYGTFGEEQEATFQAFQKIITGKRYPFSLHVWMFFLFLVTLTISCIAVFLLFLSLAIATLTLFQFKAFNNYAMMIWRNFRRMIVFTLGFAIAIFSPPFGFGIILLYFMLYGDALANQFAERMMK